MNKIDALLEELSAAVRDRDEVKQKAIKAELDRLSPRRPIETR